MSVFLPGPMPLLPLLARLRHRVAVLLVLAGAACSAPPAELPAVHVGVLASLTGGRVTISGSSTREGAELAAREINAAGGVDIGGVRHRVDLVFGDVGEATDRATSAAQILLTRPDIVAIVGPQYSRNALPVAALAENAHVPMITPMASHPGVTAGRRWVFRMAFTDDVQSRALARAAREDLHASRAAMLYEESAAYSRGIAEEFARAFTEAGGRIVARETYTRDNAGDFAAALRRLRAASPDVLLLPNELPDDTLQIRQAYTAGLRVPILLPDFVDAALMSPLPAPGGLYATQHWHIDSPSAENQAFARHFEQAFHHPPNATAAGTYDTIRLLADALHRAGSTVPDALRDAIGATRDFHAATGSVSFAGRQDPSRAALIVRVDHGKLALVHPGTP